MTHHIAIMKMIPSSSIMVELTQAPADLQISASVMRTFNEFGMEMILIAEPLVKRSIRANKENVHNIRKYFIANISDSVFADV